MERKRTMNKRKVISDVTLNILASVVPIFVLQFLILPLVASKIDSNSYGQLLTIVGLMNLSAATLGNVLNNSRLINYKKYEELNIEGDFNILLRVFFIINICVMLLGLWYYEKTFNMLNIFLIIFASVFMLLKVYGVVEFRIKLNFKYILMDSIFLALGYGIGFIIFMISGYWRFIYLCGFLSSFLFVFNKTTIFRESFKKTALFKKTTSQTRLLLISGLLLGTATYVDRLLLYPLLGGAAVSIYFTATILGKTISLFVQPVAGVILSYLAQLKKLENNNFYILLVASMIAGGIGYVFCILVSNSVLTLIYPQYVDEALKYIYVTTLTIIISIIGNILNPVVLKFCHSKWQIVVNASYLTLYGCLSLVLLNLYGLMGFCIGALVANIVKLITILMIYYMINIKGNVLKV